MEGNVLHILYKKQSIENITQRRRFSIKKEVLSSKSVIVKEMQYLMTICFILYLPLFGSLFQYTLRS